MNDFVGKSLKGEWWFPSAPKTKYLGSLNIDERNQGRLTLEGRQSELLSLWPPGEKQFTIFGKLQNKYTYNVSLFNCGMLQGPNVSVSTNVNPTTTVLYYANNILIGDHIRSEEVLYVNAANVYLTGLEQWCDVSGLMGKTKYKKPTEFGNVQVSIDYRPKITRHFDLGGGRLIRFLSHYTGPVVFVGGLKKITIEERSAIQLVFSKPISIQSLLDEIHIWQTFISLGLRKACRIDKINPLFSTGGEHFTSTELLVPGKVKEDRLAQSSPSTKLFTQSKLGKNLGRYVKGWRKAHKSLAIPILLYSGTTFQESTYSHANLLTYLQALEVLHRERFQLDKFPNKKSRKLAMKALRAAVPSSLKPKLKDEIIKQLSFIGSLTLLDRLNHLYDLHRAPIAGIFPNKEKDMSQLKEVRNFLTHFGENKSFTAASLWEFEIFLLQQKSRLFLEICFLSAMGMRNKSILKLLNQFDDYVQARRH